MLANKSINDVIKEVFSYNSFNDRLKYIEDTFGKKNALSILRQIYASVGALNESENEYLNVFNFLQKHYNLNGNILEIGGGYYPALASYIDKYQRKIGCGTITVIDPELGVSKLGSIKLYKEIFNKQDDISSYDLIISQAPCLMLDEITQAAIQKNKEFFVTLCKCVIDKYPYMIDFYSDDYGFENIQNKKFSEMKKLNGENKELIIDTGTIFYDTYSEIKYFTGKKLIKK